MMCFLAVPAHAGDMVAFPGGLVSIGSDAGLPDEQPVTTRSVDAFELDRTPVTVAAFRAFVAATGHRTEAERYGNAGVMTIGTGRWSLIEGASWARPHGPDKPPAGDGHPVTQVSWHDADAYCAWKGKRLPTEFEWEYAARFGQDGNPKYAFGDRYVQDGAFLANIWSGLFPVLNDGKDGFVYTSPVGHYGATPQGLTDMAGNVWEWTASWYRPYDRLHRSSEPGPGAERVQRGGSFLCDPKFCHGFRVSARSHSTPDTALMHVGFRCAR